MHVTNPRRQGSNSHRANSHGHVLSAAIANESRPGVRQRVVLATHRPAMVALLLESIGHVQPPLAVTRIPLSADALQAHHAALGTASVVVVDVGNDPDGAVAFCHAVRQERPDLRIVVTLCCQRPTRPWHVRALLNLGVSSLLDAQVHAAELGAELMELAGEGGMLHVRLHDPHLMHIDQGASSDAQHVVLGEHDVELVQLVALGFSNDEIAGRLHLAASTVHHHVADLCGRLGLRNRTALAGWAGANGYLEPARATDLDDDRMGQNALDAVPTGRARSSPSRSGSSVQ